MYKNLLLAVDLSDLNSAEYVVKTAQELTGGNPNAVYRVVTIIEPMDDSFIAAFLPRNFNKSVTEEANRALHEFTQKHFPNGTKVQHIVAHGTIYEEINNIAEQKNVDLIVMLASSKPKAKGLSANTVKVARNTDRPVLVLR